MNELPVRRRVPSNPITHVAPKTITVEHRRVVMTAAAAALGVRSCLLVTTTLAAINIGPVAAEDIVIA